MKMKFFKTRLIATFIMLTVFTACGMMLRAPESRIVKQEVQPVIIYSTSWCGYCTKAKTFMKKNNIEFVEKSPENPKDIKELIDLAKKIGVDTNLLNVVPIFIIKNKIIIGFNPKEILCILSGQACRTDFLRVKEPF